MFRAYLKDLAQPHAELWVGEHDGHPRAIAGWISPDGYPRAPMQELLRNMRAIAVIVGAHRRTLALRLLLEVERHHLREPHWYLSLLATDPTLQGRGIGTALLRPVLDRCDREGILAYTETQKRDNVSWYARSGFELLETITVAGAPPVWCLRREPLSGRDGDGDVWASLPLAHDAAR